MRPTALVVRPDSIGDVVLSGPAVRAVAASARVAYLAGPTGQAAAGLLPGVEQVLVHDLPWIAAQPSRACVADVKRFVRDVASLRPDVAVVLTSFHQDPLPTALLLRLAGVARIGAMSENYPGSLLDVRLAPTGDVHEVERSLTLVRALGFELPAHDDGRLRLTPANATRVPVPPGFVRSGYVVVHPGASVPARTWSAERFTRLVARLAARGERVVVTGSPGERALTASVAGAAGGRVLDLAGRTDLAGLHDVMARASVVVVGNTGPAHVAAAAGAPVVSLFAPTVPAPRWRPWRVPHVLLGDQQIGCRECRARACPVAGHPCLGVVTVDDVLGAIDHLRGAVTRGGASRRSSRPVALAAAGRESR